MDDWHLLGDYQYQMTPILILTFYLLITASPQTSPISLRVANSDILQDYDDALIFSKGNLNSEYDDATFNQGLSCRNGNLNIIDVSRGGVGGVGGVLTVAYEGMPLLLKTDIGVSVSPNAEPLPFVESVNLTHFDIKFNCSCGWAGGTCSAYNYFNKATVKLPQGVRFSFLINCDPTNRHKQFQVGYLFIALINACIIVGVAMHSHVWSIRIKQRPLRYVLKWKNFLVFSAVGVGLILSLYFSTYRDLWKSFTVIKYFGIIFSLFFVFLCLNESLYLLKRLRKPLYKIVRQCDALSGAIALGLVILACFQDNWILYNILAGCICVGSIKIFHFNSLKESYLSMTVMVGTVSVVCIILHFLLPLSYNDYAGELSSPFFLQVPDLVNNLFKKCSWLPVLDVIIPGVTLSYLRVHDDNKSSKWGGVYTVSGNIIFVVSTVIWVGIQYLDPFSFPFSVLTCPLLMLGIFIVSWRRNEWSTLLHGQFQQGYDILDIEALTETRDSFSKLMPESAITDTLIYQEVGSSIISN